MHSSVYSHTHTHTHIYILPYKADHSNGASLRTLSEDICVRIVCVCDTHTHTHCLCACAYTCIFAVGAGRRSEPEESLPPPTGDVASECQNIVLKIMTFMARAWQLDLVLHDVCVSVCACVCIYGESETA